MPLQSYITFSIRQGGTSHDCIKSLSVTDVREGVVQGTYIYSTNPENLSDIWVDLIDVFGYHQYAVAYNLSTHRSNLEKSLLAVGVEPPEIHYLCAFHWASSVTGIPDSFDIQNALGIYYSNDSEAVHAMVQKLEELSGQTVADRYKQLHQERLKNSLSFFKGGHAEASLDGLTWLTEVEDIATYWAGKTVVVTGQFVKYPDREALVVLLSDKGAKIVSAISSKTDVVVVGTGAGPSKMDKIRSLMNKGQHIVCIDEKFLSQIIELQH